MAPISQMEGSKCSSALEGDSCGKPSSIKRGSEEALSQMRSAALEGDLFGLGVIMDGKNNDCPSKVLSSSGAARDGDRKTRRFCFSLTRHSFTLEYKTLKY